MHSHHAAVWQQTQSLLAKVGQQLLGIVGWICFGICFKPHEWQGCWCRGPHLAGMVFVELTLDQRCQIFGSDANIVSMVSKSIAFLLIIILPKICRNQRGRNIRIWIWDDPGSLNGVAVPTNPNPFPAFGSELLCFLIQVFPGGIVQWWDDSEYYTKHALAAASSGPCYLLAMERVDVKPTTTSGEVRFETKSSSTGCLGLPR